jgi:DNA-binding SARP family transcriptional activator/tetratricopeptide (TPR) repeat protein
MMDQLGLRLLGSPEVYYGDHLLKMPTRKTLALLIYLVIERGFHSREKLTVLFWPESEAKLGYASLRNTLARLRAALQEAGSPLLDQEGRLGFDFETSFGLDLRLVEAATKTIIANQPDPVSLQTAVAAYRADFLEGFSLPDAPAFDDWTTFQREYWHHQMNLVFEALSALQAERREFEAGLATTIRWVAHDRLNEAAHRRLIELHFMKGDRPAALQAYANCQAILRAELGIEPTLTTKTLAQRIGRQESGARVPGEKENPKSKVQNPKSVELPFAGRITEYAQLVSCYQAIGQRRPATVVIQGEAGIGKTRLATEFLRWLAVQEVDILQGRAFEAGGRLPYQPVVEALRQRLEQENAPDNLLNDVWLAELSRLLPELRDRYPDLPLPAADEALARTRLPEAVARLGQALVAHQPLILFIDDVQWADAASLDLLHYLARAWTERSLPILLLVTLRTEALLADPSIEPWLSALNREVTLTRLSLEPLTSEETEQLTRQLVEKDEAASTSTLGFARWLFNETAGQPLFIAESLKTLVDQGALQVQTKVTAPNRVDFTGLAGVEGFQPALLRGLIPSGIRQVILARLKRLAPGAMTLLTAASVLGRDCAFEQLYQVGELSESEGLLALDELLRSRLLLELNTSSHPYRFAHDKIRDVVYTEAGDARRRIYHRRVFEMFEAETAAPAELAHHALAARLIEPAFRYSIAAGDAAVALFAIHNAISHYEQARTLAGQLPPSSSNVHHLYTQLSRAYELRNDYPQAEVICQEMLAYAGTRHPAMACEALNRLASMAIYSQQMDKATSLLAKAKQIAEVSGDKAGLAQTEWSLGQLTHHSDDFVASRDHSERALALAREVEDPSLIAGASNTLGFALFFLGQLEAAAVMMEAAAAGYAALGNRALEADSWVGLASIRILQGEIEASITAARTAYTMGQEIENSFGQAMSRPLLICALVDHGDYQEALALVEPNLAAARSLALAPKIVAAFSAGLLYWALGDAEAARTVHQTLNPWLIEAKVPGYLEQNAAHLCVDAALAGDWQTAHRYARQALSDRDYQALPLYLAPHWPETEALLRGGDLELAREDAQRWGELVGHIPRYRPLYLRSLALLAQWEGDLPQAIAHLEEAQTLAETIGLPGEQWQILAKLGELYRGEGNEAKAQLTLQRAKEIIQGLASKIEDETLRIRFLEAAPVRRLIIK